MKIKGFIKNTFIEYPGKIASIIFVPGCNFRCMFCFNPELIADRKDMNDISEDEVLEFLKSNKNWIDALVISGGEPTLQKDLFEFAKKVKDLGILVRIYTNGSTPDVLRHLIDGKLVDSIAMDIKAPLTDESYERITSVKDIVMKVKESIALIMESGIDYELRTTVVPTLFSDNDIECIAKNIKGEGPFILQRFMPENALDADLRKIGTQSDQEMERLAEIARRHVTKVSVR